MSEDLIGIVTVRQVVGESSGCGVLLGHVGRVSSVLLALFCNYIEMYFTSVLFFPAIVLTRNETQST